MESIVYCEDESLYGEAIKALHSMVRKKFHAEVEFSVVPSWNALLERVATDPPSVILLDLNLPPMSEEETLSAMHETIDDKFPPVVVLTGNKFNLELRRRCMLLGADDFMIKDDANRNPELLCERIYHAYLRRLYKTGT